MKIVLITITILLICLITGCHTCQDPDQDITYDLTEYEYSLIPFNDRREIKYQNKEGYTMVAKTQPKTVLKVDWGDECKEEHEEITNFITFYSPSKRLFSIRIEVFKIDDYETIFKIQKMGSNGTEYFTLKCDKNYGAELNECANNLTILEEDYTNVFLFENSGNDYQTSRIIYSSEKGIELIEFEDGDFLKLIE